MKVVALISGGKDSCFNMMQCVSAGHQIVALANLTPKTLTEIDSYMYQSVGHEAIDSIATAMDLPLYKKYTEGQSRQQGTTLSYEPTEGDEVEDLYELLEEVKSKENVEGVSVGAILSDYQRLRVENVCNRLNLVPLAYLWRRDQKELLDEMIENKIEAIVIKVAALGLDPHKHLGKTLDSLRPHLHSLHEKYGINVCGEGGEYETLTLDCPLFKSKILIQDSEIVIHSNDPIAPVGYLKLNKLSLQDKHSQLDSDSSEQLKHLALQHTEPFLSKLEINVEDDTTTNESVQHDLYDLMTMNDETLVHHETSFRTPEGFLFIGGIQGYSLDDAIATHQSFEILKSILHKNGHSIEDVCSISMFISGMRHYAAFNEMYSKVFTFANPPTRVCVEIPVVNPVIMSAISWAPPSSCEEDKRVERQTMHVQSRSHWAPANIGPYSQAKKIGHTVHLAGQIGLNPGNLELVKGGITAECHMTLRHAERLIQAMDSGQDLGNVVQGICYVTNSKSIERAENIWKQKNQDSIVSYVVVKSLPKNAVVEWHLWTHKHNDQFKYDETEEEFDRFEVKLRRRWSIDSGILCAIACEVENPSAQHLTQHIFFRIANYVVGKLQQNHTDHESAVCNLTIFTNSCATATSILQLPEINSHVVHTVVPVSGLRNEHTCFAISGLRHG